MYERQSVLWKLGGGMDSYKARVVITLLFLHRKKLLSIKKAAKLNSLKASLLNVRK
ncbi:hypothetical protein [Sporosarcina sp. P37]|uniref:hypothetical protein n=1 Tax=Sporosarcina sp. P37 TaxID=1930546 RepID=UPI0012F5148E|nr:hypothetical protein [Sporosarcina sp. P37]